MNTHIRNAEARKFWEHCFFYLQDDMEYCVFYADNATKEWAKRFGDEETLQDIEANKARREMGNEP